MRLDFFRPKKLRDIHALFQLDNLIPGCPQLLEFGPDGKYIREIGHNLYAWSFAHTVRVDKQDNIWVTDKGSDMVIKFSPEGRVLMVFGRKQEASDEGTGPLKHPKPPLPAVDGMFRQVTDVTWDPAGNAYISDGYINSRVARTASRRMLRATSMWPTGETAGFRCLTATESFFARSRLTCRSMPTPARPSATNPAQT